MGLLFYDAATLKAAAIGEKKMLADLIVKSNTKLHKATTPDVNDVDGHGISAAVWAAQKGQVEMLVMLHDAGADLNSASSNGLNGLM
jgi:hypothetical protein